MKPTINYTLIEKNINLYLFLAFISIAITFANNISQKETYEATAEILLYNNQVSNSLISDELNKNTPNREGINIQNEISAMQSIPFLKNVVSKLEIIPVDDKQLEIFANRTAIMYQRSLKIEELKGQEANVMIKATGKSAKKATLLAAAIVDTYAEQAREVSSNNPDRISPEAKEKITLANDKLNKMGDTPVFNISGQDKYVLDNLPKEKILEIETERIKADKDLKKTRSYIDSFALSENYKNLSRTDFPKSYETSIVKKEILELEFKEYVLKLVSSTKNPDQMSIAEQTSALKTKLIDLIKSDVKTITPDEEVGLSFALKEFNLNNKIKIMDNILNKSYLVTDSPDSRYQEYIQLKDDIKILINKIKSKKDSDANKADEKAAKKILNVKIITPAFANTTPIKHKKRSSYLFNLIIFMLLGTVIAILKKNLPKKHKNTPKIS